MFILLLIPICWYLLSSLVNFWGGMVLFKSIGQNQAIIISGLLLLVQWCIPLFEYVRLIHNKTNKIATLVAASVTTICLGMAMLSAVGNTYVSQVEKGKEIVNAKTDSDIVSVSLEHIANKPVVVDTTDLYVSLKEEENKMLQLQNLPAKNLAGQLVYINGKQATIWQATNHCSSGIYYTDSRLHKKDCQEIKTISKNIDKLQLTIEQTLSIAKENDTNKNFVEKLSLLEKNKYNEEIITRAVVESLAVDPIASFLISDVDITNMDVEYHKNKKKEFQNKLLIPIIIACLILMWIEITLAEVFIRIKYNIKEEKPKLPLLRKDNLFSKIKPTPSKELEKVLTKINISQLMRSMTKPTLLKLIDNSVFDNGKVTNEEIIALQLAVCHLYKENEQLPLKSTCDIIQDRIISDSQYLNKLFDGKYNSSIDITKICKTNRLKSYCWEAFDNIFINNNDGKRYWKSENEIELLIKDKLI